MIRIHLRTPLTGRRAATAALGATLLAAAAGCGGSTHKVPVGDTTPADAQQGGTGATTADVLKLGQKPSTVATAKGGSVQIFAHPGDAAPSMTLRNPNPDGVKRVFLVTGTQPGWLHVLLPVPPNGSEGWISADAVKTDATSYWVQVRRGAHKVVVYKGKKVVLNAPAAIGTQDTPTPGGTYYITELLKAPNPAGDYGPYAYGLSGYSTSLKQFNGNDPIIGIHGTNHPELVGTDVSHGCVRVRNDVITKLAGMLPLGTPVQIQA